MEATRCSTKKVKFSHTHYRALGPELMRCIGSRPQVTWSHPPGGRLPLLSTRPAVTFPAEERHRISAGTKLYCSVTKAHACEQAVYLEADRLRFEPATFRIASERSTVKPHRPHGANWYSIFVSTAEHPGVAKGEHGQASDVNHAKVTWTDKQGCWLVIKINENPRVLALRSRTQLSLTNCATYYPIWGLV